MTHRLAYLTVETPLDADGFAHVRVVADTEVQGWVEHEGHHSPDAWEDALWTRGFVVVRRPREESR